MPLFDQNDLIRLLLGDEQHPSGAYDHLGWATNAGSQGDNPLVQLTTLHESFHSELNNLTVYGFFLQGYAFMLRANKDVEQEKQRFGSMVSRCRKAHEIYATFVSTTVISESFKNKRIDPVELLVKYPDYQDYYQQGVQLSVDFKGNYLKEIAVTALIISCFQSKSIYLTAMLDLSAFYPGMVRSAEFPDQRLDLLMRQLPEGFLTASFERFCQEEKDTTTVDILRHTETNPEMYHTAILPEMDGLQNRLVAHWVDDLALFFEERGLPTFRLIENIPLLKTVFDVINANAGADARKIQLVLNTEPMDIPKNVLLNFMYEKYIIREEKAMAVIVPISQVPQRHWPQLTASSAENEHFFWVSRVGYRLEAQYEWLEEDRKWLERYREQPLVFLRRRAFDPKTKTFNVELYLFENQKQWFAFWEITKEKPHISNLSMHTLGLSDWTPGWYLTFANHTLCTILFDLPPYQQFESFFQPAYQQVGLHIIWMNDAQYRHCAVLFQGTERDDECSLSPIYVLPASEITCRVIYNYLLNERPTDQFVVDTVFIDQNSWLINIVVGHIFNEERIFDFNAL